MEAAELSALDRLADDRLYVFVAGPGTGESIAMALPGRAGWVVVDGSAVDSRSIPAELIEHYVGREAYPDTVAAFVLTHPHDDHVKGVPVFLERFPPRSAWVTAERPEGPHLLQVCEAMIAELRARPRSEQDRLRGVRAAYVGLARWEDSADHDLGCAVDGATIDLEGCSVELRVRAPHPCAELTKILGELANGARKRANEASVVLEVVFGETRLVLGGDLPRVLTKKTLHEIERAAPLETGWDRVLEAYPQLLGHHMLKLAHHGSAAAWHAGLMTPPPRRDRDWVVTPFNSSGLPRAEIMPSLVGKQSPIHVSHPPSAWSDPGSSRIQASAIRRRAKVEATGDPFADAAEDIRPRPPQEPLDPVWAFAYDDAGRLCGLWRGESALQVVADS